MKRKLSILCVLFLMAFVSGCSSTKAATGPRMKDLSVLEIGTERHLLLAEFESPVHSEVNQQNRRVDIFRFIQGQHGLVKGFKALYYGGAAAVTFGLSEVVTNPLEDTVGKGAEMQIKVVYDDGDKVEDVEIFKDDRWFKVQEVNEEEISVEVN